MSRILYISDTHFGHRNIIRYENRPFSSVQEMNEELIRRWNSVVTPEDTVVHGGDFALCNKEVATHICHSLNGYKVLVKGNHDGNTKRMLDIGFSEVVDYYYENGVLIYHYPDVLHKVPLVNNYMDHFIEKLGGVVCKYCRRTEYAFDRINHDISCPLKISQLYNECNIFLYGHVHSKVPRNRPSKGINISCEVLDYTPRTIEELKTIYLSRQESKGFTDPFDPIPKSVRNEYNTFKNLERDINRKEKLEDDEK